MPFKVAIYSLHNSNSRDLFEKYIKKSSKIHYSKSDKNKMPEHRIIVNTVVEQSKEIFHGHRKLCDLKISEEVNIIYEEKKTRI